MWNDNSPPRCTLQASSSSPSSPIFDISCIDYQSQLHILSIDAMAQAATWTKIAKNDAIQRSSLCVSSINNAVYVFGGELKARQPRDNDVHVISLTEGEHIITARLYHRCYDASHLPSGKLSMPLIIVRWRQCQNHPSQWKLSFCPSRCSDDNAEWQSLHVFWSRRRGHGSN